MSDLKRFCAVTGQRVMIGLAQKLSIQPYTDYRPRGYNAARVFSLRLAGINPAHLTKIRAMRDELTMWAGLDDDHRVRIGWDQWGISIEIPKPFSLWQKVTIEQLEACRFLRRGAVATLGLGLQGEPRRINFQAATTAHVLIAGVTRSGKTNTQRLIAWNLVRNSGPERVKLLIFDVAKKGYRWADFGNVAHLAHPVITDLEEAERALCWLSQEIERRGVQGRNSPRTFIFIDELKALITDSKGIALHLARIASTGAEFGLHLVMATQYPQIQMLGDEKSGVEIKRNTSTRLCGRVDAADAATNTLGVPNSGAEFLQGYGDFLLRDFDGLHRITVAKLEEKHVEQLPRATRLIPLDLPNLDDVHRAPTPRNQPDPYEPEQVAMALFYPQLGINKLARHFGIGNNKAGRVKAFAQTIHRWGLERGFSHLDLVAPEDNSPHIIHHWSGPANGNGKHGPRPDCATEQEKSS